MNDEEKRKIAEDYIQVVRTGSRELLEKVMTEDIVWSLPGASKMSGEAEGWDGLSARLKVFASYGVNMNLEHILFGLDEVAVLLHNTSSREGLILDEHLTTVLKLRGNKIHRLETYLSDVPMLNRFFV